MKIDNHKEIKMIWKSVMAIALLFLTFPVYAADGGPEISVKVDGMSCPFCAYGMEKKLKKLDGIRDLKIQVDKGVATLAFKQGATIDLDDIQARIRKGGFTPTQINGTLTGILKKAEDQWLLKLVGSDQVWRLEASSEEETWTATLKEGLKVTITGELTSIKEEAEGPTSLLVRIHNLTEVESS